MLRTRGLTKRFGGITAVDEVDFELEDELCSLIGPNGAGKTTFFDLLTGAQEPTSGRVELQRDGEWIDLTERPPDEIAGLGLHRSYQITNVFPTSTVLENVRVAVQAHSDHAATFWRTADDYESDLAAARSIIDRVGLTDRAEDLAQNLSHGASRQLEVAIALAGDPDVLLLDEPNAGVSSESVDDIIALIEDVAEDHAVLLVEHNMDIVMEVSDRVVVLNQGSVIADGEPSEVRADPSVQEAYLGGYETGDAGDGASDGNGPDGSDESTEGVA